MGWVKRKKDEHVCAKPVWARDIAVGDVWQCDTCRLQYRVARLTPGQHDQREGWYGGVVGWENHYEATSDIGVTSWRDR